MPLLNHYPNNEKHCADQFADSSRINSQAFKDGWDRIFGPACECDPTVCQGACECACHESEEDDE